VLVRTIKGKVSPLALGTTGLTCLASRGAIVVALHILVRDVVEKYAYDWR
jgi:hypothetical protein